MPYKILCFSLFFLLCGCYKNHLYVQQEKVDRTFLASSFVQTPDPRQLDPPQGQRLLIAWRFPSSLAAKQLSLKTTVRFWNQTEEELSLKVTRSWGSTAYFFPNPTKEMDHKILTYKVEVWTEAGDLIETWEHQFWTPKINPTLNQSSLIR